MPFAEAPVESYRIDVTGGPTTVGGPGTGKLSVGERILVPVAGEGATTSEWLPVDLVHQPTLPSLDLPMVWHFSRDTDSYDVASFTVEYRHYVPVS